MHNREYLEVIPKTVIPDELHNDESLYQYAALVKYLRDSNLHFREIKPDQIKSGAHVIVVCNSLMQPNRFLFRPSDQIPIGSVNYPGKSAWIDFLSLHTKGYVSLAEQSILVHPLKHNQSKKAQIDVIIFLLLVL